MTTAITPSNAGSRAGQRHAQQHVKSRVRRADAPAPQAVRAHLQLHFRFISVLFQSHAASPLPTPFPFRYTVDAAYGQVPHAFRYNA